MAKLKTLLLALVITYAYHFILKIKEILFMEKNWMSLEDFLLSVINHEQKDSHCMMSHTVESTKTQSHRNGEENCSYQG